METIVTHQDYQPTIEQVFNLLNIHYSIESTSGCAIRINLHDINNSIDIGKRIVNRIENGALVN